MADEDEEEDWFESALREESESETESETGAEHEEPEPSEATGASDESPPEEEFGGFDESAFEADAEAENPFAEEGEEDDLFEDDFADAFAGAEGGGGGTDGGEFGGGMGGGPEEFDDEEFESAIPRISIGVEGLDEMIQGGVPDRSLMVVMGSAGTGKTTFGLQFIAEALENDERAAFIALEETKERVVSTADEKGWEFSKHIEAGNLAIVDMDPVEMANSLSSIRSELPRLVDEFGAERLVLDSVSLLELMYDDQATRRTEVYRFTKALKEAGVTTMVTSEASSDDPFTSRYGIIEYLTDAVFVLRYLRGDNFQETRLAVEIQKIRDANHSRETKPYEITNTGISVYRQANIF